MKCLTIYGPDKPCRNDIRGADAAPAGGGGEAGAPWVTQGTSVAARGLQKHCAFLFRRAGHLSKRRLK